MPWRLIERFSRFHQRQSPSRGLFIDLILVIALLACLRNLVVESSFVLSDSMEPTLKPGDWLLVDKLRYIFDGPSGSPSGSPKRGDIVVFNAPLEPGDEYVKRVVAVPGDTVQIEGGRLILNGTPLEEAYLSGDSRNRTSGGADPGENRFAEPVLIPPGKYLVLGDNRPASKDSRSWGLLDGEEIIGRADLVYFSYSLSEEGAGVRWNRLNLPLD